ncbi:MAG: SMP-30/gluconolactonase/LRE family protein [Gemmatimonadaceae bacterium]
MELRIARLSGLIALAAACTSSPSNNISAGSESYRLPTGAHLDPAGRSVDVGGFPLALVPSPDGRRLVLLLNGFREQGVQVLDRATGEITQTLVQRAAFLGLVFSPDGKSLYASGGDADVIYKYNWSDGAATLADSMMLTSKRARHGTRYPGGIALSPDSRTLYVAENLGDSLAVVDIGSGRVTQRLATERYPYGVAVSPQGDVFVSAWGGSTVSVFSPSSGSLRSVARINAGRHPSALLMSHDGTRLFVASGSTDRITVIGTRERKVIAQLLDPAPAGPSEGSTPNAFALSDDGTRLFVAEADNNAIGVFDLSADVSGIASAKGNDKLAGRIPVGWYPTVVWTKGDSLVVVNGKGRKAGPNPAGPQPIWTARMDPRNTTGQVNPRSTTRGQLSGTVTFMDGARASGASLAAMAARVARANGWTSERTSFSYPPIEHVIYIIKENRTYDQVFGDLRQADGDPSLLFFPRSVSPNHHALAERFGIFDRFFVNAEVSPDGHNWSTGAYTTDYVQKTVPANYSNRGRSYDYEGTNREHVVDDDVAGPSSGYLWDLAQRAGLSFRNYGEFVIDPGFQPDGSQPAGYTPDKPALVGHTNLDYAGFAMNVPDQKRADVWISELQKFERAGKMPALEIVRLPNDHTSGATAGSPTPRAYMADNDLALGRMIEALSKTQFWKSSAVFVLEDDSQNGPDHVDSHRSVMMVISPYASGGVVHRFVNTTDVVATIEDLLKLGTMSQFDYFGRPLREIWRSAPDLSPYVALTPAVSLEEKNPRVGIGAEESKKLALGKEDEADEDMFNRILWRAIKGESVPYPGATRIPALELKR